MNKQDLVAKVVEVINETTEVNGKKLTKKDATVIVDAVFGELADTLVAGEEVKIANFGKFSVDDVAGRMGVNPQTSEPLEIAPYKRPKFKASSVLKNTINGR